jgi:arylsulfatase A-like enzyme
VVKPGSSCDVPVSSIDFYPTMLEIAGVRDPAGHAADGTSIVPLLKGGSRLRRNALYWHYPHYSNQGGTPGGAVRSGDYKLIEFYDDHHVELYNVATDVGEKTDLAGRMADKAGAMRRMLHDWRQSVNAAMPQPNPAHDASRSLEGLRWITPK